MEEIRLENTPLRLSPGLVALAGGRMLGGRYRLERELGSGATGVVYAALHADLQRRFAVKVLHPQAACDERALARFRREAVALGRLRHPNIVDVTEFDVDAATRAPFLVMELLEGPSLAEHCRGRALPWAEALELLEATARALDAAHAQGVLHRDLKPENVILAAGPDGKRTVKVVDFGLAKLGEQLGAMGRTPWPRSRRAVLEPATGSTGATGMLPGTPHYLAPEIIAGQEAGPASDRYSFGILAYRLLTGELPFEGTLIEVLRGHYEAPVPCPAELAGRGQAVWKVLCESLAKDPARRPTSASEIVTRLRSATTVQTMAAWRRQEVPRRAGIAVAVAAVVELVVLAFAPAGVAPVERSLRDLALLLSPPRSPDPRLLLLEIESATEPGSVALGDRADEVASAVERLFDAGAAGVGIDLLLPHHWSDSAPFSAMVLRHASKLTLAAAVSDDGEIVGTGAIGGLTTVALGPEGASTLFGLVNTDEDPDGLVRHARYSFTDVRREERPSWAAHLVAPFASGETSGRFEIDHRVDSSRYPVVSLDQLDRALREQPALVAGRLVLIGANARPSADDFHRVPARDPSRRRVSGLTLQALQVDSLLSPNGPRDLPRRIWLPLSLLFSAVVAFAALLWPHPRVVVGAGLLLAIGLGLGSIALFVGLGRVAPVSSTWLALALTLGAALALRRVFVPVSGGELEP